MTAIALILLFSAALTAFLGPYPEAGICVAIYMVGFWIVAAIAKLRDALMERR